jgi:hypothetical protein
MNYWTAYKNSIKKSEVKHRWHHAEEFVQLTFIPILVQDIKLFHVKLPSLFLTWFFNKRIKAWREQSLTSLWILLKLHNYEGCCFVQNIVKSFVAKIKGLQTLWCAIFVTRFMQFFQSILCSFSNPFRAIFCDSIFFRYLHLEKVGA